MMDILGNESEVSDVDPEELSNLIKGVDDLDDELFGFSKKKTEDQKSKIQDEAKKEKSSKSKLPLNNIDIPVYDPLADISLSDDDFFNIDSTSKPAERPTTESKSLLDQPKDSSKTRAKKIADLFGLEDDVAIDRKSVTADDWLGIKNNPEKKIKDEYLVVDKKNSVLNENKIAEPENVTIQEKANNDEPKRKQSVGKASNAVKDVDDLFSLLDDKTREPKSQVLDDIFGEATVSRGRTSRRGSDEKKQKADSLPISRPGTEDSTSQYIPSLGASRRSGLGRRRDVSPVAPTVSKVEDDWLLSTPQEEIVRKEERNISTKQSNLDIPDKLPTWLGGTAISNTSFSSQRQQGEDVRERESTSITKAQEKIDVTQAKTTDVITHENVINSSSAQNDQTLQALQKTEAQLIAALELKQQHQSMEAVCHRQSQLLALQEAQVNSLVEQHLRRQSDVEIKLQAQQERIGLLLEALMSTNIQTPSSGNLATLSGEQKRTTVEKNIPNELMPEIESELNLLRIENENLKLRIEFLEKTHQNELASLTQANQRDLNIWHEQEERLKSFIKQTQDDYETRIQRLQESTSEQLRLEKERIERLQEERLTDLKQLGEFHRVMFEQVATISKMLPREIKPSDLNSLIAVQRPSGEGQLTAREAALIQKEVELSGLQEKLTAQKDNLDLKGNELEEKMDVEKLKNEEIARQLKRERRELQAKEQLWLSEQEHMKEQQENRLKYIEELRENVVKEQTELVEEKLQLAEERARLEALTKLQGVAPNASFDILQARAEVHGALEATKELEMELNAERQRLREIQRAMDVERWKLQEYDQDLIARANHLDHLLQVSEENKEEGRKAFAEAKKLHEAAEERMAEVEQRIKDVTVREQNLTKDKMKFTQEEMRLSKRREQLEHILPELSSTESLSLQPLSKHVIDPKMLIMKLKAEKELDQGR